MKPYFIDENGMPLEWESAKDAPKETSLAEIASKEADRVSTNNHQQEKVVGDTQSFRQDKTRNIIGRMADCDSQVS